MGHFWIYISSAILSIELLVYIYKRQRERQAQIQSTCSNCFFYTQYFIYSKIRRMLQMEETHHNAPTYVLYPNNHQCFWFSIASRQKLAIRLTMFWLSISIFTNIRVPKHCCNSSHMHARLHLKYINERERRKKNKKQTNKPDVQTDNHPVLSQSRIVRSPFSFFNKLFLSN